MFFGWITTRRGLLTVGYGFLFRGIFAGLAIVAVATSRLQEVNLVREISSIGLVIFAIVGILFAFKKSENKNRVSYYDLFAALAGFVAVVAGAIDSGGIVWIQILRFLSGALFIGVLTDTMLLGHWYLVQPGLKRNPLKELLKWSLGLCLFELLVWILPFGRMSTGMISALRQTIDDGHEGLLGWFWLVAIVATIILVFVSDKALKEKGYQAVMATTGLAYLSLLTGFVADIMARLALRGF